jgi:aminopeptidase
MTDIRMEKLAELVIRYSTSVKPGDKTAIIGNMLTMPLMKAIFAETLRSGGHPMIFLRSPDELLYRYGSREQIEYVHEPFKLIYDKYDVRINVFGESNTRELTNVNPEKIEWYSHARRDLLKTMMKRSAAGSLKWVIVPYPVESFAQDAEMSLTEYADFLYRACMPDLNDPIGYWQNVGREHQRLIKWLKGKKKVHVTGKETDLTLSIEGRKFVSCDGHYNLPDGEIFTGPVEDSAEGYVYYSYPAIEMGREVTGIRLWFHKGKVVKATAEKNEEFLLKLLDTDEGARYLGEFAIGTNYGITGFTREILFDEKIGGSFHMAVGAAPPETGGRNESAIHWDMVCDLRKGGRITVDDVLFYENGKFTV